jgi:hypothetical protein
MKYTIAKQYEKETRCLHCLEMLRMAEKWLMPDDSQMWTCNNCSGNWIINCGVNEHHLENAMILHIRHRLNKTETTVSNRVFEFNDKVFKEQKVE